ncbi:hypothetical protein WKG99_14410 [Pantoea agglomerans]|uniref:hypothetical protein n=2 Tax=Pantoea TaxID=53335 RepID=UPI002D7671F9|nr:hypothetical protein [Pantoea agglomerans]WRO91249.1 hypothetical protein U9K49_05700 [Pantoea agglomerans]
MIDIKNNLEIMWIYFPANENEILHELHESSSFEFYERYLLELSAREFIDFFQYLLDYKIDNNLDDKHSISQLISYGFGQKSILDREPQFENFQSIQSRVADLRSEHLTQRIKNEQKGLGSKIEPLSETIKKQDRL